MRKWIARLMILSLLVFSASPSVGAEEAHGQTEAEGHEAHYSILHGLFKIPLLKAWVPQPPRQPDLILNLYFLILVLTVLLLLGTRGLRRLPERKAQNFLEVVVEGVTGFLGDVMGAYGRKYALFPASFFLFILCQNLLGLFPGFQAPTADLNTTLGMAIVAIGGVQVIAIRELGFLGYIKHFIGEPAWLGPLMFPMHIIGELARVLSLSLRLFGNIFGEDTVIITLASLGIMYFSIGGKVPIVPVQLPMMLFGILGGIIQATIFSILTSVYIAQFLAHKEEQHP